MIEISVAGVGRERGIAHGSRHAALIHERVRRESIRTSAQDLIAKRLWNQLCTSLPDYAAEVSGIAAGAEADLIDVFSLTAHEIFHGDSAHAEACTNIATTQGGPKVAKNSDGEAGMARYLSVIRSRPAGGLRSIRAAWVGGVGVSIGVNEAGVAYAGAALPADGPPGRGIPMMAIVANALDHATSADEGAELAKQFEVTGDGFQGMWIDAEGAVRRNETLPGWRVSEAPEAEWVVHTNWPIVPASWGFASASTGFRTNSQDRADAAREWTNKSDVAGLVHLLQTHGRGGLCQHGDEGFYTAFGAIAFATQHALLMTGGPPCAHEFSRFDLGSR